MQSTPDSSTKHLEREAAIRDLARAGADLAVAFRQAGEARARWIEVVTEGAVDAVRGQSLAALATADARAQAVVEARDDADARLVAAQMMMEHALEATRQVVLQASAGAPSEAVDPPAPARRTL